ncbi:MAG: hypothetical protein WDZ62_01460 [Candidatus Pacearchaeota archaeon]
MTLQEAYPNEWDQLTNKKVAKKDINKYLLNFVARLVCESKEGRREDIDIGDGWSMVLSIDKRHYKLNPEVYGFLFRLGDYGMQDSLGYGTSDYGDMLYNISEVEPELKKVAKKLGIKLDF